MATRLRLVSLALAVGMAAASAPAGPPVEPARPPQATRPAAAPSGPILPLPELATAPAAMPAPPAASVREALDYDADEKTILADVQDGDGTLSTPALQVLLRRAAMLPPLKEALPEADRPGVGNLWREPERYRGRLVSVEGLYAGERDYTGELVPSRRWRGSVHGVLLIETHAGRRRSILLLKPGRLADRWRPGRRVTGAGLFYKLVRLPVSRDGSEELTDYAVIVGAPVSTASPGRVSTIPWEVVAMFGLVFLLLFGFFYLRRRMGRRPGGAPAEYRPLRAGPGGAGGAEAPTDAEADEVDEELRRQVAAYRAEHPELEERDDAPPPHDHG